MTYIVSEFDTTDDGEPMFLLLARDPLAPNLLRQWARDMRLRTEGDDPQVERALAIADAMEAYRVDKHPLETDVPPDGVHVPDPVDFRTDFRNHGNSGFEEIQDAMNTGPVVDSDVL